MDRVSVEELKYKLAGLFGIQSSHIGDIFVLGPSSIHIMVTDEVKALFLLTFLAYDRGTKVRLNTGCIRKY